MLAQVLSPAVSGTRARAQAHTPVHMCARTHTAGSQINTDQLGGEGKPDYWTTCSGENRGKSIIAAFRPAAQNGSETLGIVLHPTKQ